MTISDLQAKEAIITMWGGVILLAVLSICATILLVLALRRYSRDQDQAHAERMASIQASKDMGQTAWAHSDVHKSVIIREQAKRIAELEGWKARTVKRMKDLRLSEVFDHE
jgi:membrane protein implicated in regulation of membrane protease activity